MAGSYLVGPQQDATLNSAWYQLPPNDSGHPLVVVWNPRYESLGIWYNDTGKPVEEIDFFGNTPAGQLKRVEALRPGLFWHVWVEFFPHTDINRVALGANQESA